MTTAPSDPYVTGVGGTKLTVTSSNAFSKEVAWSGGGGGKSSVFTIPSWQKAVQKSAGGGYRQVPDVSAHANPSPGVSIYSQGSWSSVGGTSAAAPEWAAFAALYNQQAAAAGKANLGFANPALYSANGTGSATGSGAGTLVARKITTAPASAPTVAAHTSTASRRCLARWCG